MTDAGGHDRLTAMRILATLAFAVAAACAVPAQAACDAPVPAVEPANSQPIVPGSEAEQLAPTPLAELAADSARKSVVSGKSVSVRVDLGGGRIIKKKKKTKTD